ncbi:NADPH-dependent FMN reductase [Yinghuangia sp. YIM S10712]|uniref:NADPH-dependent FMN reductase n=1 Tax=Yinghuangia sp. YIM S10712 TaxID=3436930 RepID=UPI003F539C5E
MTPPAYRAAAPSPHPLTVAVLIGSTREGRAGLALAEWFADCARERADLAVDTVDLAEFDFPARHPAQLTGAAAEFVARVDAADAFVVVTPEYNHGYPASLKQAIDLPYEEWRAKPVGFLSYGGLAQGLRAVEQLRQVFAELHAVTMRDGVSFNLYDGSLGEDGRPPAGSPAEKAAQVLLDQLTWWAHTLREGRQARPYAA